MPDIAPRDAGPGLIREWIDRAARLSPDKPYIVSVEDGRVVSFAQFRDLTRRIAAFLRRQGIGTNDRIALFAGNSIEHVACYVGVMAYGATICTVHVEMNRRHLGRIVRQLRPRLAIHDESVTPEDLMPEDLVPDHVTPENTLRRDLMRENLEHVPIELKQSSAHSPSRTRGECGNPEGTVERLDSRFRGNERMTQGDAIPSKSAPGAAAPPLRLALGRFDRPEPGKLFAALADSDPSADTDDTRLPATGERDDAVIFFTSGTSEKPKGVVLSYREQIGNVEPMADGFGISGADRIYDYRSFNWASAQLFGVLAPLARGATLVMARKFSASRFFDDLRVHRVTIAAGNPTIINMLLNTDIAIGAPPGDVPSLRFLTSSSAPLLPQMWRRFEARFGIPVAQGYGASETAWIAVNPGRDRRFGSVGRPLAYHRLAIVDRQGRALPAGEIGEVEIGGWHDNEYRTLGDDGSVRVNSRGRLRTGDIGFLDADGFLHLTGREKDLIIRGGVNISPLEIDAVLMQRAEIAEAATVGVPDAVWGEEVVSYVVLRPGAKLAPDDLLRFCAAQLPAFKAPKRIVLCAELPKSERGKLDRKALAAEWSRAPA